MAGSSIIEIGRRFFFFWFTEIFGNFVSGLIILFERRCIGDTVTIGSFSGTVSKIRIRATATLPRFDRKEVIIRTKRLLPSV